MQLLAAYTVQNMHTGIEHSCVLYMTFHTINSIKTRFCKPRLLFESGICVGMQLQKCRLYSRATFVQGRLKYVACNLRTCAVCTLHGAKYAVCRLHGTQSADCMVTVQTKDPSKTCDSFSKFQRNPRFSARINFLTKLPDLKENNLSF